MSNEIWPWVVAFLMQHHEWVCALLLWPILSATVNVMLRKKTPEEWEQWALSKPVLAFGVEVCRAAGLDPVKLLTAFQRLAARRAGQVPADAVRAAGLPEPLKKALLNPELVKLLNEAAIQHQTPESSETMVPPPPDAP